MKRELLASGLDVIDVGIVHTPGAVLLGLPPGGRRRRHDHRQPQPGRGQRLQDRRRAGRRSTAPRSRSCASASRQRAFRTGATPGKASDHDILKDYVAYIANNIQLGPRRFKVVVDGGNGTGGIAAVPILKTLGVDVDGHLLRSRRPLPQPPPRSDGAGERRRPDREGARDRRRGGHRAGRRRRPHRRRRRQGPHHLGRPAGDAVRARHPDAQAERDLRQRGEVQPGAVRRDQRARRQARSCGRSGTR